MAQERKDKEKSTPKNSDETIEKLRVRANVATLIAGILQIMDDVETGKISYTAAESYLLEKQGALANAVVQNVPLPVYTGGTDQSGSWSVIAGAVVIDPNSINWPKPDSSGVALLD